MTRIPLLAIVAKAKNFPRLGGREPFSIHPAVMARMADALGFELVEKATPELNPATAESLTKSAAPDNPMEAHHVTAPQDIDASADGYSAGLSRSVT